MIRGNPMHNTKNPPGQFTGDERSATGQVKYLRDMIKKYYDEESLSTELLRPPAPTPLPSAEKRLERLVGALTRLSNDWDKLTDHEKQEYIERQVKFHKENT